MVPKSALRFCGCACLHVLKCVSLVVPRVVVGVEGVRFGFMGGDGGVATPAAGCACGVVPGG